MYGRDTKLVKLCLGNVVAVYHSSVEDHTVVACTKEAEAMQTWAEERLRLGKPSTAESWCPAAH